MTAETTTREPDRRRRAARAAFAAVWTAGAVALFVAGAWTADYGRPEHAQGWLMAAAGLVMLLGYGPLVTLLDAENAGKGDAARLRAAVERGEGVTVRPGLAAARGHLDKAAAALSAPYPEDLTPQQRGEIGWLAARHQQAALEAILEHLG